MTISAAFARRRTLFCLFVLAAVAAVLALPFQMRSQAAKGLNARTESHDPAVPNYDIRTDKKAIEKIAAFRDANDRTASQVADIRDAFVQGEAALRQHVPTLKVEYNADLRIPEVIGSDVRYGAHFLTAATRPAGSTHADVLIDFLSHHTDLIGLDRSQIDGLRVAADHTNPDGNLSFVELDQEISGIPVFRGEVKAGFTKRGEMIRVINNLAPGLDSATVSTDFGDPRASVRAAAALIDRDASKLDLKLNSAASTADKAVFGTGDWATTAEKMYFPTEPGVAVPAWRVLIWQPVNAYYVIVDAATHVMLWRKNITEDQTQSSTFSVYTNTNAMVNVADNPFPFTPGPTSPNGTQGSPISRVPVTRIGNEAPYTFNNSGWITDGGNMTDGNAVQAGLDRDQTNGVDPNGEAVGSNRDFSFAYNPLDPNTNTGDIPFPNPQTYPGSAFQQGAITQLFYICNWYHDETYRLGFTEQARNFQGSNFGRGGLEGDRVSAEAQDGSGTNNANFGTPADGGRGRMQMYVWDGPEPDIDGDLDAAIIIHEHTHGLSNRLHGNGSGLTINMSRGMGEGWSDFYAHSLLSEPTDPINGIYTIASYATYRGAANYTSNYYYGIRRFPLAVKAFTGGPNNLPHDPLTFKDADATQFDLSRGAFPRGPFGSSSADAVHNLGEIWSSMLWEVRARLVTRLGWEAGNRKALQLVTDGMKLAPLNPTFLSERDAIIAAAQASAFNNPEGSVDVADFWAGFAIRGLGASATIQDPGVGGGTTRVTEAFDLPNLYQTPDITISDPQGNGNGFAEPGETITLTIPLTNISGNTATNTTLQVVGGGSANYGDIASGMMESREVSFTVPLQSACGSVVTLTLNVNSSLGPTSFTRTFATGRPTITYSQGFDSVPAPGFPEGWTAEPVQGGINFVTTWVNPDAGANAAFAQDPTTVGGGTNLTSPSLPVIAEAATVSFRQKYDTEAGWDGAALEISIAGGPFQDVIAAGGVFLQNGYNGSLGANGVNNPLGGRQAWTGDSRGYRTTVVRLPAAASGHDVRMRWRFGADDNTGGIGTPSGWWVDSINFAGTFACGTGAISRADFDGDGQTDVSVFRPSEGNWYLQRTTAGFGAVSFGLSTDVLTPGDFDGDGKADIAVWRPSNGTWYRFNSSNGAFVVTQFGLDGDIPQAADFDGDGKVDIVLFRPSNGAWYRLNSSDGAFVAAQFGLNGDLPVVGDYDADGKADLAVYRSGRWFILGEHFSFEAIFGLATDMPTPADYDGDGRQDLAVFRPSDGTWYRINSGNQQFVAINFGINGDVPVPGDYDGDGRADQAVYRSGIWYLNRSTAGFTAMAFGLPTDVPVPKKYIP